MSIVGLLVAAVTVLGADPAAASCEAECANAANEAARAAYASAYDFCISQDRLPAYVCDDVADKEATQTYYATYYRCMGLCEGEEAGDVDPSNKYLERVWQILAPYEPLDRETGEERPPPRPSPTTTAVALSEQ